MFFADCPTGGPAEGGLGGRQTSPRKGSKTNIDHKGRRILGHLGVILGCLWKMYGGGGNPKGENVRGGGGTQRE